MNQILDEDQELTHAALARTVHSPSITKTYLYFPFRAGACCHACCKKLVPWLLCLGTNRAGQELLFAHL